MHYISTAALRDIVLETIRRTTAYARENENEFVEIIRNASTVRQNETARHHKQKLIKNERRIAELDNLFQKIYEEFVARLHENSAVHQQAAAKENSKKLAKAKRRREEVSGLIKKLYESYATGKIPENHFSNLLNGYDEEQGNLDSEIVKLQAEIEAFNTDSVIDRRYYARKKAKRLAEEKTRRAEILQGTAYEKAA